ncbi:recombinase [Nocardia noduli]|uniref:recombinase n=1 Tax=Nocardia noduli TaxID=2815722 RepID=UPI001C245A59|nr:recombinase [Nocardia noduli]
MPPPPEVSTLSAEYRRQWTEFEIWCEVTDHRALPAAADTVCAYLGEQHGAALGSQRARVAAINAVHRLAELPEPGDAEPIRQLLNPGRGPRSTEVTRRVHDILPGLPTRGWPQGLFGRRDAALLTLAAAGLPFTTLAELRQRDLHLGDDAVTIGAQPLLTLTATGDEHSCPVRVMRRWTALLIHLPHGGAPVLLEHHLTRDEPSRHTPLHADHRDFPVLAGFDWRGTPRCPPPRHRRPRRRRHWKP